MEKRTQKANPRIFIPGGIKYPGKFYPGGIKYPRKFYPGGIEYPRKFYPWWDRISGWDKCACLARNKVGNSSVRMRSDSRGPMYPPTYLCT